MERDALKRGLKNTKVQANIVFEGQVAFSGVIPSPAASCQRAVRPSFFDLPDHEADHHRGSRESAHG